MRLFVFGMGYSSRAFVERTREQWSWIGGTTRSPEKADALRADGIEPFLFDGTERSDALAEALASATHVLVSIAPGEHGDPVLAQYRVDLSALVSKWIGYLSTVGVYGDHDGAWVDEETPVKPVSERSVRRVAAENAWLAFSGETGIPVGIFRLSGIYGPGRNAFVNLDKGTARRLVKPGQVFNRIHVDDIAGALEAAIAAPATRLYNVTDDEPAPPQDVVEFAARLMGVPCPPETDFATADLSPMARSFYGENKRVSNARVKQELGYSFRHPTYREALTALLESGWR
ncbi:SDR family oxidoreductase [Breoghania sp. L-A4]|uniref:SDR family oxidoreductase n=1 Tax=Breoghania sp. L-A4 TaxID=2304600 RepID=UPI000E360649|nr:SDR family oxidoreductase [Breoghania sp. L-A4]AXS39193.1 SDR family oxidoreductase [Breoghania sp. L-A4]